MDRTEVASVHVVPAPLPATLDAADADLFLGAVAVERAASVDLWGDADVADTPLEAWSQATSERYGRHVRLVAVADDAVADDAVADDTPADAAPTDADDPDHPGQPATRVLGSAYVHLPTPDNTHLADVVVTVDPGHRRRGIGTALARAAEALVTADGRRLAVGWTEHAAEPTTADDVPALTPPTGSGRIPIGDPTAFAQRLGYVLEQAERHSVLDLPVEPALLEELAATARARSEPDYRLVTWTDETPARWLAGHAVLMTRMSTDPPLAGLEMEEDRWDGDRVREFERTHRLAGHRLLVAAAEHVPTGTLAAYTILVVRPAQPDGGRVAVFQDATLVLKEHRGHRLGLAVKVRNVRAVEAAFPDARRIHTWNAEENAHMLGINVALGFRPAGISGLWQKHLVPDAAGAQRA